MGFGERAIGPESTSIISSTSLIPMGLLSINSSTSLKNAIQVSTFNWALESPTKLDGFNNSGVFGWNGLVGVREWIGNFWMILTMGI